MTENSSNLDPIETDQTLSSTGGLPPDFFDLQESPASQRSGQSLPARDVPLPPRLSGDSSPRVVLERRASLPVVLVVIAGNVAFFLGGGLAGWAAARKWAARTEPPASAGTDQPLNEVVRAIDAKASKSAVDAVASRIVEMQLELGTLGRELARLEGRVNAGTKAPAATPPATQTPTSATHTPAPAPPDLAPLRARIDDLVKESQRLSPIPATLESLRQRVDALDKGVNAVRIEFAAVPKRIDASLNALKDAMVPRPAAAQTNPADLGRELGAALFLGGRYSAAREVFTTVAQTYPNDARLWYFAALANGLASGVWTGETENFVRRGLACEEKGSPKRSDIDAQFSGLTKEQGKVWLEEWRKSGSR